MKDTGRSGTSYTRRIGRFVGRTIVILLAMIGLKTVMIETILPAWKPKPDLGSPNFKSVSSPDGNYKAVQITYAGGGGFAAFCRDRISVMLNNTSGDAVLDERLQVYSSDCGSFADHQPSPRLQWTNNQRLQLTVATGVFYRSVPVILRGHDASRMIEIDYSVHN
jgi:hypothetical protein